ncbi:MAG: D-tyrosyl-tRNA(Tyr) deacylase [Deltaproteobacteria bacterium]|nr:D-tyrosyl-tRNA(Tyr) deacylase [Deltaproteobacteria bacterium]
MRAVVQRCTRAEVRSEGEVVGRIERGLCVLLGAGQGDGDADVDLLVDKIVNLRIFDDAEGKMNLALGDVGGALLVVSQFTLYGDARKGRRPSFIEALGPDEARALCDRFVTRARGLGVSVETGRFRTAMQVELVNDGPVTLLLDSRKQF